jgi:aldehyde:ferredoxin oxidoreductase
MEAYDKKLIDEKFLDGIDLRWGSVDGTLQMLQKIARREGVGDKAAKGVKALADVIGQGSGKFAMHCKGHSLAAWNCHVQPSLALCYATANRGACHLNGHSAEAQDNGAMLDSTGLCRFATEGYGKGAVVDLLEAISDRGWSAEEYRLAGERIFNLEKCFNYREGFRREDDEIPDRFFEEPLTVGPAKGAVLDREKIIQMMDEYYAKRGWDPKTTRPSKEKLESLGLGKCL